MLAACSQPSPGGNSGYVPADAVQLGPVASGEEATAPVVEPHRYGQLTDLAAALRKAGYACEAITTYKRLQQDGRGASVYKVDCLEYAYRLTFSDGQSRIERWAAPGRRGEQAP